MSQRRKKYVDDFVTLHKFLLLPSLHLHQAVVLSLRVSMTYWEVVMVKKTT